MRIIVLLLDINNVFNNNTPYTSLVQSLQSLGLNLSDSQDFIYKKEKINKSILFDPTTIRGERLMEGLNLSSFKLNGLLKFVFLHYNDPIGPFYTFDGKYLVELVEEPECKVVLLALMFTKMNKDSWPQILDLLPESLFHLDYVCTALLFLRVEYKSSRHFQNA